MDHRTAFALGAALLAAGPAFGHAKLLATAPAANEQLAVAPKSLTLKFNESVRLGVVKLTTGGHVIPLTLDANAAPARQVSVDLPALAAGTYQVDWSALTPSDGHVVKGTYSFVIR